MTSDSQREEERNALRAELELLRKQNEQYKERLQDLERQLIQLLRNGRGRAAAGRDAYAGPGLFDAPPTGGGLAEPEEPEDPPQDPPPNRPGSGSTGALAKRGRKPPPAHLPREEQLHRVNLDELPGYDPKNGHQELSWETSEQLRFIPAQFVVTVHKRQVIVYTDAAGEARIVAADGPSKILGKGLPHETALAKIASDKYYLHLPLYRMTQAFAQLGYALPRSTLGGWLMRMADLLEPIHAAMSADLHSGLKIHIDDTEVKVLDPGAGRTATHRAWVLIGGAEGRRQVVFLSTPQRTSAAVRELLAGYEGYLQAGAATVYDGTYKSEKIIEVGCWSHAYRKFDDLKAVDGRVLPMREMIGSLYDVEDRAKELSEPERKQLRQEQSEPILKKIRIWIEEQDRLELIESQFKKALRYTLNQWTALNRYLEHGALEADNNISEGEFHVLGVGRRNYLFFGGVEGLKRGLVLFSLVRSCVAHGIEPYAYFVDILPRIERHPARLILDLTPAYWKDLIVKETGRFPALYIERAAPPQKVPAVAAAP